MAQARSTRAIKRKRRMRIRNLQDQGNGVSYIYYISTVCVTVSETISILHRTSPAELDIVVKWL